MVTFRHDVVKRPWKARGNRDGVEFYLGYFKTREEAVEKEREFDLVYSRKKGKRKND